MFYEGYENILNVDWSEVCIDYMKKKYDGVMGENFKCMFSTKPQFLICNSYLDMVMDVREMNAIGDNVFDCVIDKGCLDSILVLFCSSHFTNSSLLDRVKFNCKCQIHDEECL